MSSRANKQYLNWKGGLNTEKSKITGDVTSFKAGENVVINRKGEVSRRKGLILDDTYKNEDIGSVNILLEKDSMIQSFVWSGVNGNPNLELLIIRIGFKFQFYDLSFPQILDGYQKDLDIDISVLATIPEKAISYPCSGTYGTKYFYFANKYIEPFYLKYYEATTDAENNESIAQRIETKKITITIRDFDGVYDEGSISKNQDMLIVNQGNQEETLGLTKLEDNIKTIYNLLNQGWGKYKELPKEIDSLEVANNNSGTVLDFESFRDNVDYLLYYEKLINYAKISNLNLKGFKYPSNTEVSQGFKNELGEFDAKGVVETDFGNTYAPKGHFILNYFNKDRKTVSLITKYPKGVGFTTELFKTVITYEKNIIAGYRSDYYKDEITKEPITGVNRHFSLLAEGYEVIWSRGSRPYNIVPWEGGEARAYSYEECVQLLIEDYDFYFTLFSKSAGFLSNPYPFTAKYKKVEEVQIPLDIDFVKNQSIDANEYGFNSLDELLESFLPTEKSLERPTNLEFYSGRVFYASSGKILFSQIANNNDEKIGRCYQEQDPTAEVLNTILDTDGGEITINGCSEILELVNMGAYLMIIANNGVWAIRGGQNGFTATAYAVDKLSDIKIDSKSSIVRVEGGLLLWSREGIISISINDGYNVRNISEERIQTYYENLSSGAKLNVRGIYSDSERKVYWYYRNSNSDSVLSSVIVNEILVLDLVLSSFTILKVPVEEEFPQIVDILIRKTSDAGSNDIPVTHNGLQVEVNGESVIIKGDKIREPQFDISFLTLNKHETLIANRYFSFGKMESTKFVDWFNPVNNSFSDYVSFIETEYEGLEDIIYNKQAVYLHSVFNRTEKRYVEGTNGTLEFDRPSSCYVTAKWDYIESSRNNRWSTPQQCYRMPMHYIPKDSTDDFDFGYTVISSRNKIRGGGKVVTYNFESETGKDFQMLGFAVEYSIKYR